MRLLTPTGYRNIEDCQVGDEVSAFDLVTGAPLVNVIETKRWIDYAEWARWWEVEPEAPAFTFYRINGTWALNSEQSIWRNGAEVCHAKRLIVGDTLYDDADQPVTITSIEEVTADGWWRFDISGDHSYIVNGLTLHNASRFWVLGTGTWDAVTTTNWAASTGGAGGQSVPGSADTVTLDGSSGGGTVTVNFGGTITLQQLTCGAFTGTLDFSVNNNSVTLTTSGFSGTGSATRTIKLGNGTWTLSQASGTVWNINQVTGLTFNANSSTISLTGTGTAALRTFTAGSGLSYNIVSFNGNANGGAIQITLAGSTTIATLNISAPNYIFQTASQTLTVTNALNISGSSGSEIGFASNTTGTRATVSSANNGTFSWCAFKDMAFAGGGTFAATSSFDLGDNTGITITAPASGGGGPVGQQCM